MKNLRIASKLLVSFSGAGLLLVALIAFSIFQLGAMNKLTDTAVNNRLPKLMLAQAMKDATANFRVTEGIHILLNDDAGMSAAEATMRSYRSKVDQDYQILISTVQVPQAREALVHFHAAWTTYLAENAKVRAFSRAHQNDPATALMTGKSRSAYEEMTKAGTELVDLEAQLAKDAGTDAVNIYSSARLLCIIAVVLALAALGAVLVMLVRQIAKPVSIVTEALSELANGKMDVAVPASDRKDEVGELARAMTGLRDQLAAAERSKAEQTTLIVESIGKGLSGLAEGDLVSRVEVELTGPFAKLKTDFNAAAASLQATLSQVAQAATGINGGAGEIRQASDDLSHRTEQQAASLEETAAAMDEITSTVRKTAERAGSANAAVRSAREEAEHSGSVVRDAVDAMGGIERTSNEISEIISVIDGIAFQTNLLALNAGVEAARAGDAGKGFAVVASEVRALAQRSAEAAKDVKARINASSVQVTAGVQLVGETGQALARIIDRIQEISGLVSEIAVSAEQQATGLHQVNTAVTEMDGVTQQNAAMVEEATAAARSLAAEADSLTRQIARFQTGDISRVSGSPVHHLQDRAAKAVRQVKSAPRHATSGNAALAQDDWSAF